MSELLKRPPTTQKPKLLHQIRAAIRTKHYSIRTEESYVNWVKRFVLFHNKRHPNEMGEKEINELHKKDLANGYGSVNIPYASEKKYPNIANEFGWQYLFPATKLSIDPRSGIKRHHHLDETVLQKAVKQAIRKSGIIKHASCHTFRHSVISTIIFPKKAEIY